MKAISLSHTTLRRTQTAERFLCACVGMIAVDAIRSLGSAEDWRYHPTTTDAL